MHWFYDPTVTRGLPLQLRAFALYCRCMGERAGRVRGGSFLLRSYGKIAPIVGFPRDLRVIIDGTVLFADSWDMRMLWALDELRGRGMEALVLRSLLSPGDTFIDIGANHGAFSLLSARMVLPTGRVLAFEPNPHLASLLRRSLSANGYAHATVQELALGEVDGEARLHIPSTGSGSASLHESLVGATVREAPRVGVASLDSVLASLSPLPGRVLIKIDVEGSELSVLSGARRTILEHRPVLVFENSPMTATAGGFHPLDVVRALEGMGYHAFTQIDDYPARGGAEAVDWTTQQNVVAWPCDGAWAASGGGG